MILTTRFILEEHFEASSSLPNFEDCRNSDSDEDQQCIDIKLPAPEMEKKRIRYCIASF